MENNLVLQNKKSKDLYKISLLIGCGFLLMLLLKNLLNFGLIFVLKNFFDYDISAIRNLFNSDFVFLYFINSIFSFITLVIPFWLVIKFAKKDTASVLQTGKNVIKGSNTTLVFFSLGMCMLGNLITTAFSIFLQGVFSLKPVQPDFGNATNFSLFETLYMILCVAVMPALVEEFVFRGAILGLLRPYGKWPAIIVSSLLFSLIHGNFVQIPFAFIVGLALGMVSVATKSIWPAILIHFLNNAYSCVAPLLNPFVAVSIMFMLLALGFVFFLIILGKGYFEFGEDEEVGPKPSFVTLKVLVTPTILITVCYYLYEAIIALKGV